MAEAPLRLLVPDEVVVRDLADEALLVHLGTGTYFGLDAIGARMWHLLAEQGSPAAALPPLLREFEVEEERLCRDLDSFVAQLLEKGLLTALK